MCSLWFTAVVFSANQIIWTISTRIQQFQPIIQCALSENRFHGDATFPSFEDKAWAVKASWMCIIKQIYTLINKKDSTVLCFVLKQLWVQESFQEVDRNTRLHHAFLSCFSSPYVPYNRTEQMFEMQQNARKLHSFLFAKNNTLVVGREKFSH